MNRKLFLIHEVDCGVISGDGCGKTFVVDKGGVFTGTTYKGGRIVDVYSFTDGGFIECPFCGKKSDVVYMESDFSEKGSNGKRKDLSSRRSD